MRFLPSYLVILFIICTVFYLTRRNSGIGKAEISDDVSGNVRGKSSEQGDKAPCRQPVETRSNNKDRRDQLKCNSRGPETVRSSHLAQQATVGDPKPKKVVQKKEITKERVTRETTKSLQKQQVNFVYGNPLVLAEVSYSSPFDEPPTDDHVDVPSQASPEEPSTNEDSEENEVKDNEPEEPKEEASTELRSPTTTKPATSEEFPVVAQQNQKPGEQPKQVASVGKQGQTQTQLKTDGQNPSGPVQHTTQGQVTKPNTPATPTVKQGDAPVKTVCRQNPPKAPTQPGSVPEVRQEQKSAANLQGSVKKEQAKPAAKPVTLSERAKKVDPKLFDVRESSSNGVPLLTCTPKDKKNPTKLVYGDETIWDGGEEVLFLSALIYFKGDKPEVVTLQYKENGKDRTLFLHYNGYKWEHNKKEHEKKLNILRGVPPSEESSVTESAEQSLLTTWSNGDPTLLNLALQPPQASTEWYLEKINENWNDVGGRVFEEGLRILKRELKHAIPITLDLANPNESQITVETGSYSGVEYKGYTPKRGHYFSSFSNDGSPIWTISRGERCFLAQSFTQGNFTLFTLVSDFGHKYFEKLDGKWREGRPLKDTTEPDTQPTPLPDLKSKIDSTLFDVRESSSNGVPLLTCTPKPDVVATELKYGNETIWDGEGKVEVLLALIYFKGEKPEVVTVQYRENEEEHVIFLHYNGEEWINNRREHERKLCGLKGLPTPQSAGQAGGTTLVTLDLAHPDDSNINVDEQTFDEVLLKSYFPRKDHHISSVVENGVTLWKATGDEKCTSVQSHVKDSTVMTIGIKSGDDLEAKFFEKNGGVWKTITEEDFDKKLGEISKYRLSSSNPTTSTLAPTKPSGN